jgi:signal transduction histidine kinase
MLSPPRDGLTPEYVAVFTGLTGAMAILEFMAPGRDAHLWKRVSCLLLELLLSCLIVRAHGTLIRPTLIYLVPASRALLLFNERQGLAVSLLVWVAYGINLLQYGWPDRLYELPGYLSFVLPLYLLTVVLTLAVLRQSAGRQRLQGLYDELARAHAQLQELSEQARTAAVAQERNRLAREIHDSVAHYLTVINVQLEAAEKLAGTHRDRAMLAVRQARRLTLDSLRDVRRSVRALRASTLEELSLAHALEKLVQDFSSATSVDVELCNTVPADVDVPPEIAQALYRVAQEGLTNVQKHAAAQRATVALESSSTHLTLTVRDDGRGRASEDVDSRGFGLIGLRERLELHGGRLIFRNADASGSELIAAIPLDDKAAAVA